MVYREGKKQRRSQAAEEGLVVDMVRQFADRYAFVRELVQNGIDAGASELQVKAQLSVDGEAAFSVSDDGEGMDRETIEGPLLTLFSSAKDGDSSKIGKYGVGFVSVFALQPDEVVVETWRQGERWILRLRPDHSYELSAGEPPANPSAHGTRVSLHRPMVADDFHEHVQGVGRSLRRWCRHAHLPIHWVVEREGSDVAPWRERADQPFDILAPVQLNIELDGARFVVGPAMGGRYLAEEPANGHDRGFAGFYNRGLTLHETEQPASAALEAVRFKVDCPSLQHTLSRDNVRHDDAYRRVLTQVDELVSGPLRSELIKALERAAVEAAGDEAPETIGRHYMALLAAACSGRMNLDPKQVAVPLAGKLGGSRTCCADELLHERGAVLFALSPGRLAREIMRGHRPVLLAPHAHVPELLSHWLRRPFQRVDHLYTLVQELPGKSLSKADRALLRNAKRALQATGASFSRVRLGRCYPAKRSARAAMALSSRRSGGWHLEPVVSGKSWSGRFGRSEPLVLLTSHRAVLAARRLARTDAAAAGELLARYLLTEDRGELSKAVSDALLAAAVERGGAGQQESRSKQRAKR